MDKVINNFIQNGCVKIEDIVERDLCYNIHNNCLEFLNTIDLKKSKEYDNFIVGYNRDKKTICPFSTAKPFITTRGHSGYDKNFVEMFRVDRLFEDEYMLTIVKKTSNFLNKFLVCLGKKKISNLEFSIYWNKNVDVRGFHRDVLVNNESKDVFKLFIYLTDVSNIEYGPYSYIEKTHNLEYCLQLGRELPMLADLDISPKLFLGKAGTSFISNQKGLHRGEPQLNGKTRMMFVCKARV
tara:strand:+ start:3413 stop:4129 length:717 start_codon:yes stop_codon:yes gene_type:complete